MSLSIPVKTKGGMVFALVDDDVYLELRKYGKPWMMERGLVYNVFGGRKCFLARWVMRQYEEGSKDCRHVGYKNGDKLDCRRENLVVGKRKEDDKKGKIPPAPTPSQRSSSQTPAP